MDQLHKLAGVAKSRGKNLTVVYDHMATSKVALKTFKDSLKKKYGLRVRFVPDLFEQ